MLRARGRRLPRLRALLHTSLWRFRKVWHATTVSVETTHQESLEGRWSGSGRYRLIRALLQDRVAGESLTISGLAPYGRV